MEKKMSTHDNIQSTHAIALSRPELLHLLTKLGFQTGMNGIRPGQGLSALQSLELTERLAREAGLWNGGRTERGGGDE
jgi:hypothetical protein